MSETEQRNTPEQNPLEDPDVKEFLDGRDIKEEDYPTIAKVLNIPKRQRKEIAGEYHNTYQFVRDGAVEALDREIKREKSGKNEEQPSAKIIYLEALKEIAQKYDWSTAWNFNVVLERSKYEPKPEETREEPKKINVVDSEFGILEHDFGFADGMNIARDMFDELDKSDSNLRRQTEFKGSLRYMDANANGNFKHYFLPNIPGGEGGLDGIREAYTESSTYLKSGEHVFVTVKQGEMWSVPLNENPYFKITMSECSVIMGKSENELIVAHISYSEKDEIEAVLDFMKKRGVAADAIYVVASLGNYQEEHSNDRRATSEDFYKSLGIPDRNIVKFEFDFNNPEENVSIYNNMASVLVNKRGFLKWGFDLKDTYMRLGPTPIKEEKIGEIKDEVVTEF